MGRFDDLGPLPKEHPREKNVRSVERALINAYNAIVDEAELTNAEQLRVLADFMSSRVGTIAKYAIRHERHGHGDKPGGIE